MRLRTGIGVSAAVTHGGFSQDVLHLGDGEPEQRLNQVGSRFRIQVDGGG
jgi:hypothetical protein